MWSYLGSFARTPVPLPASPSDTSLATSTTPDATAPLASSSTLATSTSRPSCDDDIGIPDLASQTFLDDTDAPATLPEMGGGGEESKMRVLLGLLKK